MARYENEFMGIYGDHQPPRGMDPNYRGGYGGMRMQEGRGQANYGYYRWRHQRDLGPEGGFYGRAPFSRPPRGEMGSGYGPRPHPYDAGMRGGGGGGVRDVRYDPDFMRDFNADSPLFREGGQARPRYGRDFRERGGHPIDRDPGYRFQYGNRGMSSGGYSQPWAFGPMRGSRDR